MKVLDNELDTIKREGKYYFLVEVDEPNVEGGWGFCLFTVDARNTAKQAVQQVIAYAQKIAQEHLSEYGTVKVRRIGEDAVIAVEHGQEQATLGFRQKVKDFVKRVLKRHGLALEG